MKPDGTPHWYLTYAEIWRVFQYRHPETDDVERRLHADIALGALTVNEVRRMNGLRPLEEMP